VVSHELRTPLTAIRGALGLLAAGVYDEKPEKSKSMLQIASQQSDRLVRLVNDILDLGRLESGIVQLEFQCCDATMLIQQSVDTMRSSADLADINLVLRTESAWVKAAPDAIVQTLTNLLGNAIKFSPPQTQITVSTQSILSDAKPWIRFAIQDQGPGIPHSQLQTIFDRFQQVDPSDSREKGGTGLGLAICRQIVTQHGGKIWAESFPNQGSTFIFMLPSC
jgi:signal transduction histidine kinase